MSKAPATLAQEFFRNNKDYFGESIEKEKDIIREYAKPKFVSAIVLQKYINKFSDAASASGLTFDIDHTVAFVDGKKSLSVEELETSRQNWGRVAEALYAQNISENLDSEAREIITDWTNQLVELNKATSNVLVPALDRAV